MGTYTGTALSDTITPETVSAGVTRVPAGSSPSAAADTINGLGGNDTLNGGGGTDTLNGGDGNDSIINYSAGNIIHGNGGADNIQIRIYDSGGSNPVGNTAYGDDGDDEVNFAVSVQEAPAGEWLGSAPTGIVSLYGGVGNDRLAVNGYYVGAASGMTVNQYGGAGDDQMRASAYEFDPDGSVLGMNNTDVLYGCTGNDQYQVFETKDAVVELPDEGLDTVFALEMDYTLPDYVEALVMSLGYSPDSSYTGIGNTLNNVMTVEEPYAARIDYVLDGAGGDDVIYGCVTGNDLIYGGGGSDIFDYDAVTDSRPGSANRDVILDFAGVGAAVGDRIDLATIDANASKTGNQAFVFKGTGAITGAGQVHVIAWGGRYPDPGQHRRHAGP